MHRKAALKRLLRKLGYSMSRVTAATDPWARRLVLFQDLGIDVVLDIGAHVGNYAAMLRDAGYGGVICSFEPQPESLKVLRLRSGGDADWHVYPYALSDFHGEGPFIVSERASSSSLGVMSVGAQGMAGARPLKTIEVDVRPLDHLLPSIREYGENIYVKIDAQGAEKTIILGGKSTVATSSVVEVELSIGQMYEDQWNFLEALNWFFEAGYYLHSIEPGFADPSSGRVMQVDAIFVAGCHDHSR